MGSRQRAEPRTRYLCQIFFLEYGTATICKKILTLEEYGLLFVGSFTFARAALSSILGFAGAIASFLWWRQGSNACNVVADKYLLYSSEPRTQQPGPGSAARTAVGIRAVPVFSSKCVGVARRLARRPRSGALSSIIVSP